MEDPEIGNLETRKTRQRRYQFYRRLGAKTLGEVTYFVPSQTEEPAEKMLLMVWQYPETKMESQFVKQIIQKMYQEIYSRPQDDPLLKKIIQEIPDQIELL